MPIVSTAKMTARQFLLLGADPPGIRLELVDGEIAQSASPLPQHSLAVIRLSTIIDGQVVQEVGGILLTDCDTVFGPLDVRRPDLLYFTKARQHLVRSDRAIEGPPDLCIEVLSKGAESVDRIDKFSQYAAGHVSCYWIVDPANRTIEAYVLSAGQYILAGEGKDDQVVAFPPFPKLRIALSRLWFPRDK